MQYLYIATLIISISLSVYGIIESVFGEDSIDRATGERMAWIGLFSLLCILNSSRVCTDAVRQEAIVAKVAHYEPVTASDGSVEVKFIWNTPEK